MIEKIHIQKEAPKMFVWKHQFARSAGSHLGPLLAPSPKPPECFLGPATRITGADCCCCWTPVHCCGGRRRRHRHFLPGTFGWTVPLLQLGGGRRRRGAGGRRPEGDEAEADGLRAGGLRQLQAAAPYCGDNGVVIGPFDVGPVDWYDDVTNQNSSCLLDVFIKTKQSVNFSMCGCGLVLLLAGTGSVGRFRVESRTRTTGPNFCIRNRK